MQKRPAASVPGVLAIGAHLVLLHHDSGYARVYRPSSSPLDLLYSINFRLVMGFHIGVAYSNWDQSCICSNLGFLWSQGQVSAEETQYLSCLTGEVDMLIPVEVIRESNS